MQRLLIVDDDTITRDQLRGRLADSFEVFDTGDPEQALSLALKHRPDGILLDLEMPLMAGVELCQALRGISYTARIPIFVITEKNGSKPKSHHPELSVNGSFEKPIDLEEIKNRLTYELDHPRPQRRAHVRIRMRTILKLRGKDAKGNAFDELTATENVSAGGFLCNSTTPLEQGAMVEVFLVAEGDHYAGRARLAHKESFVGPWQRYGFQFEEKTGEWILQE